MIKFIAKTMAVGSWLAANWWVLVVIAVLVAIAFLASQIQSCNSKRFEKQTENQKSDINQTKGEVKQIEEQRNDEKQNIKKLEFNSNTASNDYNSVFNTDSSSRNASREAARKEWCKDHPTDSKCR